MKGIGKTTGIILCAALLALALGTSAALAYFSDYEPAAGKVTFSMQGETTIDEGDGTTDKNISIKNTGGPTDADVVVRVAIYGPEDYTYITCDNDVWHKGTDGWYYYKGILAPNDQTPADTLKAEVLTKDGKPLSERQIAELGDSFKITVIHESVIASYEQNDKGDNVLVKPSGWELPVDEIPVQ